MTTIRPAWGEVFRVPPSTVADDLVRLPDDGYRYELYEGVVVREMTVAGHGAICQRLGVELGIYARTASYANPIVQNTLVDLTPAGATACTVLAPDLAILRATTPLSWTTVVREPPLLAVEVVSQSQTLAELALKAQTYITTGVEEVWAVEHQTRVVDVWTAHGTTTLSDTQTLTSPLLPGFAVAVRFLLDG